VEDWFEFLSAYHEAVLGWVGGSVEVDGRAGADPPRDGHALRRPAFRCCWTYINGTRTSGQ